MIWMEGNKYEIWEMYLKGIFYMQLRDTHVKES